MIVSYPTFMDSLHIYIYMDVSKISGTPKSSIFYRVFHYKPSILGYHHFRKHPYIVYTFDFDHPNGSIKHHGERIDCERISHSQVRWRIVRGQGPFYKARLMGVAIAIYSSGFYVYIYIYNYIYIIHYRERERECP